MRKPIYKRTITMLLAVVMVFSFLPATVFAQKNSIEAFTNKMQHRVSFYVGDEPFMVFEEGEIQRKEKGLALVVDVLDGETCEEPDYTPESPAGMKFAGWFTEDSFDMSDTDKAVPKPDKESFDFDQAVIKEDTDLYAVFAETGNESLADDDFYIISLKNYDNQVAYSWTVSPGDPIIIPSDHGIVSPTQGHYLKYWYDESAASPEAGRFIPGMPATGNLTLKPFFSNENLLIFISEGTQIDVQLLGPTAPTVEPSAPTRSGYTFAGWVYYNSGAPFEFGNTISANTMIKATWVPDDTNYTVVYWQEKANIIGDAGTDINNYEFHKSKTVSAQSGTPVSDLDFTSDSGDYAPAHCFYSHYTCINDTILGNGSTVVNIYYKRTVYTIKFNLNPKNNAIEGQSAAGKNTSMAFKASPDDAYSQAADNMAAQYSFEAKLDQDITDLWPSSYNASFTRESDTYASFGGWLRRNTANYGTKLVTHRWTLSSDLIPSAGTVYEFYALWNSLTVPHDVKYYFEQLIGDTGTPVEHTDDEILRRYILSDMYSQEYSSSDVGSLSGKEISGMKLANTEEQTTNPKEFFYIRNRNSISFYTEDGTIVSGKTEHDYSNVMYGESLELYEPSEEPSRTDDGGRPYEFRGWCYDAESLHPVDFDNDTMPDSSLMLFAKWESTQYTIRYYDRFGGTLLYEQGRALDEFVDPNGIPELADYYPGSAVDGMGVFKNWIWEVSGMLTPYSFDIPVTKDIVLYGSWGEADFSVTYDGNGNTSGTPPIDNNVYISGVQTLVLDGSGLKKNSDNFAGWQIDGVGDVYYPGSTVTVSGNVRFVARYSSTDEVAKIKYIPNGGSGIAFDVTVLLSEENYETANKLAFTRTGYEISAWNTAADGSGKQFDADRSYSMEALGLSKDMELVLYAQWAPVTYSITFAAGQGGTFGNNMTTVTEKAAHGTLWDKIDVPVPAPAPGYVFTGWAPKLPINNYVITSDATYTATFSLTYTITFAPGSHGSLTGADINGNVVHRNLIAGTKNPAAPSVATENGWRFTGWSPAYSASETVNGNVTYVAQYSLTSTPSPDLAVSKASDIETAATVGDVITYTITIVNRGNSTAYGVVANDSLASGVELISNSVKIDGRATTNYVTTNNVVSVTIGQLAAGESAKVTLDLKVTASALGRSIENIGTATCYTKADYNGSDAPDIQSNFSDNNKTEVTMIDTVNHVAYIIGYDDNTVRPDNNISRAETTTTVFRLLTDTARKYYWSKTNNYPDVDSSIWYNNAVSTMTNAGIINGYPNGNFGGDDFITRAEFATILVRFGSNTYTGPNKFSDIDGHWAASYINSAAEKGWVEGYTGEDAGKFKPEQNITRAEAMTMINRVFGRASIKEMHRDIKEWSDNSDTSIWYYKAVQEATNHHEHERDEAGFETWTKILPTIDWSALERLWSTANG